MSTIAVSMATESPCTLSERLSFGKGREGETDSDWGPFSSRFASMVTPQICNLRTNLTPIIRPTGHIKLELIMGV